MTAASTILRFLSVVCLVLVAGAYSTSHHGDRRAFLKKAVVSSALVGGVCGPLPEVLADGEEDEPELPPYANMPMDESGFYNSDSGLKFKIVTEGTGPYPPPGASLKVQYTGWLDDFDSEKKFDSSRDRPFPFYFPLGKGKVIRGWEEAFSTMKVGDRRLLIVPPRLGYGERGAGGIIPPDVPLYFDVELVGVLERK
eukprot:CAMPEP_0116835070 /NCGR_PEP_ID=MMETSP0418-20121206/7342_1 /TAXON_ID=1158023 /ORGANISM="Astrosyne radiata, Strain 13vi08-1A" /LENGTH=196 /DNA_ID=CAMNT_0004464699 /DNA_START=40 /DNA_END=630 /DNA_ORIENTATION=+